MKHRVNYLLIVNEELRAKSIVVESKNVDEAKATATRTLTQTHGEDMFRITTAKPW